MLRSLTVIVPLLLAAIPALAASEYLVINAAGTEPATGSLITSETLLSVPTGGLLVLLSPDGTTVTIQGPHDGPIPAAEGGGNDDVGVVDVLSSLWEEQEGDEVLGSIRAGEATTPEDPWLIDSSRPGDQCAPGTDEVVLWRPQAESRERLSIRDSDGARARVTWRRGEATLAWPEEMPPENGAAYKIRLSGVTATREVTLHVLPDDIDDDIGRAVWLAEQGCREQAMRLLSSLR